MDAVLFDLDGVVLEAPSLRAATGEEVAAIATERALAEIGVEEPPEAYLDATRWGSYDDLVDATDAFGIRADPEAIWRRRERHLSEMERESIRSGDRKPYDDVDAIDRLADESVTVGVVSNARHDTVNCAVTHLAFDAETTIVRGQHLDPTDWYRRKPKPDYVDDALERAGVDTGLYVGDSETDIIAADRAGIDSAFVRRRTELDRSPTYEFDTLYDLFDVL